MLTAFPPLDRHYLCSFSEIDDSVLMWSHYADYHRGFCLEYPITDLLSGDIRRRMLFPIVYSDQLFDCNSIFQEMLAGRVPGNFYPIAACLQKARGWGYEREWRLVFPFGLFPASTAYPMPTPSAVYLGARSSEANRRLVREVTEPRHIPLFEMKLSRDRFSLERRYLRPITDSQSPRA